jgi:hypothetical protein
VTPLQKIAMGLVIVLVDASFAGHDGVPDPLGWALVVMGLLPLRARIQSDGVLLVLAVLSLAVSLVVYPPQVGTRLDPSAGWALSLPQLAFTFVLCTAVASLVQDLARRLRPLRWAFAVGAVGPVLVFGGGLDVLIGPIALVVVAADVYLVYLLFRASARLEANQVKTR